MTVQHESDEKEKEKEIELAWIERERRRHFARREEIVGHSLC